MDRPFTVNIDKSHIQPINARIYIKLSMINHTDLDLLTDNISLYNYVDNMIVSEHNVLKIDTICKFNETIKNKNFKFSVSLNKEYYSSICKR